MNNMDNVIKFYPKNAAENPDNVLEQAIGTYDEVLIIGWDKSDELIVRANLKISGRDALWLVEQFKVKLLRGDYADD